jgi:hypothetical protein
MSTIHDVVTLGVSVGQLAHLFGSEEGTVEEFTEHFRELGKSIAAELGYDDPTKVPADLPRDTEIGPDSQAKFEELKAWLKAKNIQLKS